MSQESIAKSSHGAGSSSNEQKPRTLSHVLARELTAEEINAVAGSVKKGPISYIQGGIDHEGG
jgi:hypothetical protein